jgi:tetratricopeptide (TPR) repeat protein
MKSSQRWFLFWSTFITLVIIILIVIFKSKSPQERALQDYYLANKLYDLKSYEEAVAEYRLAIRYNPKLIDAYYNLAICLEETSYQEAATAWEDYFSAVEKYGPGNRVEEDSEIDYDEVANEHLAYCYYMVGMNNDTPADTAIAYLHKYQEMQDKIVANEERSKKVADKLAVLTGEKKPEELQTTANEEAKKSLLEDLKKYEQYQELKQKKEEELKVKSKGK